ncbi:fumarylacetoacetate hydrolase family protein [Pseudonocardia spinosispora]|uniref:fumarylacetoacetate hydrolase family protein n=1 Tax=Pseudonocardia spinosispora TaxID=103441 RepID=UPI00048B8266|nr:fumarylacetoacetate hydrolase family protein [Pseudonocardia spinosispora]
MHIVRFADDRDELHCGLIGDRDPDGGIIAFDGISRIADLLALRRTEFDELVAKTATREVSHRAGDVVLLPPVDGRSEVWAAGVTYRRSREARVEESTERSVYERVYDADRPELFLKAVPWRVVTDGEPIAIREDSALNVPEPELGVVANRHGEIIGYVVVNDVSSRTIEGENPLYLPQAKIYAGSAALSTAIRPASEVAEPGALDIGLTVRRNGTEVFGGTTSTAQLNRTPDELVDHLFRGQPFPDGAVLATGTGIVPSMDFTLQPGDEVRIEISEIGVLTNRVVSGQEELAWLVAAADVPGARARR